MKDTIVIPDLHGRSFWKEAVDKCLHSEEKGSWGERRKPHDDVWNTLGRASKLRGGIDECGSPVWADVKKLSQSVKCTEMLIILYSVIRSLMFRLSPTPTHALILVKPIKSLLRVR